MFRVINREMYCNANINACNYKTRISYTIDFAVKTLDAHRDADEVIATQR